VLSNVNTIYRLEKTTNGNIYLACSGIHDIYQWNRLADSQLDATDTDGKIIYSADGGASWQLLYQFKHPVYWIAADPGNKNRMYAAVVCHAGSAGGIYYTDALTTNPSAVWNRVTDPPRTIGHPANIIVLDNNNILCTYSAGYGTGNAPTKTSGVFQYSFNTGQWTDCTHADAATNDSSMFYWTKDIIRDPKNPSTWYACTWHKHGAGGVFAVNNTANAWTWTKITGNTINDATSMTFDPADSDRLYITTEYTGIWVCDNIRSNNIAWRHVDGYNFRQPERIFFNPSNANEMWVTSYGNGINVGTINKPAGAVRKH